VAAAPNPIVKQARTYEKSMVRFLRDIVAIPSESGQEKKVIDRIRREMKAVGAFDEIRVDGMGNLIARLGNGPRVIAIDAHVDTVGVGDRSQWKHDPYKGKVANGIVFGRGAGDQEGAIPAMVYGARIIKDLGLQSDEWTLLLTCTVMEEDCDGLCWQYLVKEEGIRPECVVVTDSTNCRILRGQRGRMEIGVTVKGKSCHGSMPHKGDNAIYKVTRIIREIEKLNPKLRNDPFLGKGTIVVTYVDCKTPSLNAVPDHAYIHLDRRLTTGDTKASALKEVRDCARRAGVTAKVEVPMYSEKAYTGLVYETEKYFPTWVMKETAAPIRAAAATYKTLFRKKPPIGRWTFSTNGVSICGMYGIPCVGFGPAPEETAHTINDQVPIQHLVTSAAFYAAFPNEYCASAPAPKRSPKKKSKAAKPRGRKKPSPSLRRFLKEE